MKLEEAVDRARELEEVGDILEGGGFLCSAYIMLDRDEEGCLDVWNLAFYSKKENEITAVEVSEDGAKLGVTDAPLREDTGEVKYRDLGVDAREGMEMAREVLENDFGVKYRKMLFSLKSEDGKQVWRAVFVGRGLSIITVSIDTETCEVLEKERKSMGKGMFGG